MIFNKIFFITIIFVLNSLELIAQNQSPIVENVVFTQRTDGSFFVDVYYDVNDPEGSLMTVNMQASNDNGVTWTFSCDSITGDVGAD